MVWDVDSISSLLIMLGGVARWGTLRRHLSRAQIDRAVATGVLVRVARGRFALPGAPHPLVAAIGVTGVVSHRSAAALYGWELKETPAKPDVTVPRDRRLEPAERRAVQVHYADLDPSDIDGPATSRRRTLLDCLRHLPFDEALAIADGALRREDVSPAALIEIAAEACGPGSRMARRVAQAADAGAANPFESVLRALCIEVGLDVETQVPLHDGDEFMGRPDLTCRDLGLIIEADSYGHHGSRSSHVHDCHRYNAFVAAGWIVLRFTWEDVILRPDYVRGVLRRFLALSRRGRGLARARTLTA